MGRRDDSRDRSPPRRKRSPSRRNNRRDSRSRSRSRGGKRGGGGGGSGDLSEWGTSGTIVDLKSNGFGFIRPHTGKVNDKDLFFHQAEAKSAFHDMRIDDEVTYEVKDDRGKPKGVNVKLAGGGGGGGGKSRRDDSRDNSRDRRRR
eukprot:gnl/TRDRNA2_/TRDRNA2_198125_c0_seq1.p1 gnl/TRDRNA2_/TRDRNA2_198125_c0~~gnl/TRDRNA2_/TRDRNA2_198125_c0_seq1.p1  ORF type:complete len:165 (+),score=8.64 gnl/TRDRNA2_/TRDRNA2_198125_c0_seq1:60-497(+)